MSRTTLLLAAMVGAGTFAGTMAMYQSAPVTLRRRTAEAIGAPVLLLAAVAALAPAPLTGSPLVDTALTAVTVTLLALAGATASRLVVVVATALLLLASPAAAAGLGLALAALVLRVRLPAIKAAAAGVAVALAVGPAAARPGVPAAVFLVATTVLTVGAMARTQREARRGVVAGIGIVSGLAVLATGAFAATALSVQGEVTESVDQARDGLALARSGDVAGARGRLENAALGLGNARSRLDAWWTRPAGAVPIVARQARAARMLVGTGERLAQRARTVADQGDLGALALAEGKTNLLKVRALEPPLRDLVSELRAARRGLGRERSPWLIGPLSEGSDRLEREVTPALASASTALEVAKRLPAILGDGGRRRYFVALQNPAELRATGGIIGSFAVLVADHGELRLERVGRDSDLNAAGDPAGRVLRAPAGYLARYAGFQPAQTWQNVNLSPDFPTVAAVIEDLYPQSGGTRVDGVVSLDTRALAALLGLVGPVSVPAWPEPITAANAEAVLEHEQYLSLAGRARDVFLATVVEAVFQAVTTRPLPLGRPLADALRPAAKARDLMVHLAAPAEQRFVASLGLDGRMPEVRGDFLAVTTQNSSGNKIDWFLRRSTDYRVRYDPGTGATAAELTVILRNLAPASGLPDYVIGGAGPNAPRRGENRTYLSVYSPLDLSSATADGTALELRREAELGRKVYSGFVTVPPGGSLAVRLSLAGTLSLGTGYRLDVRHQVLRESERFTFVGPGPAVRPRIVTLSVDRALR